MPETVVAPPAASTIAVDPSTPVATAPLLVTPLNALHRELGARMVPFAGYDMPVSYPAGIVAEHRHCRKAAALFDVSHMGQIRLVGADAAAALETLVPMDIAGLPAGKQRYAFFTNDTGGIDDDLMVTRLPAQAGSSDGGDLLLIVNASCKQADLRQLQERIGDRCSIQPASDRALLALQGPSAAEVMFRLDPASSAMSFMTGRLLTLGGIDCFATRSGYTGEDGYEISVAAEDAERLARLLLAQAEVEPAGLGSRDTLRLEAGLCLHGHDIDASTSPVEAGLTWAMQKIRKPGGARSGGYPGASVIEAQLADGPPRRRVGLIGVARAPVREGAALFDAAGKPIGRVTSGTLAPTVDQAIAMAYVDGPALPLDTELFAEVRGRKLAMRTSGMPFAAHHYHRG
ncbi:MAG: Aminomethyltransferase glycine cleavage system protein [Rhizobacter sp.]|nr:Aminomethyltransferase glycine cleavage system protein [Rhizobacter sp.]